MYYSPCYAGCAQETNAHGSKAYTQCTCIHKPSKEIGTYESLHNNTTNNNTILDRINSNESVLLSVEAMRLTSGSDVPYEAINTMCESTCNYLGFFLILACFTMFFTFLSTMPALSATLRWVTSLSVSQRVSGKLFLNETINNIWLVKHNFLCTYYCHSSQPMFGELCQCDYCVC